MATQPRGAKSKGDERSARNAELLTGIVARHEAKLRRQATHNAQLPSDVEDALQEAYALFLEHYDGRWPALPYLLTTVKRCAWAARRRASRRREIGADQLLGPDADGDIWELLPHAGLEPPEAVERAEALERRREALAQLKRDEQRALLLLGLGLSYAEIAEVNDWTYTKVNRCVAEGRVRLRELLENEEGG
jgi:RNA polymerase sigma factor (sigma-70 family)